MNDQLCLTQLFIAMEREPIKTARVRHSIQEFATQPVILWILLGGKSKWLPLRFGFNEVMRTAPIAKHRQNSQHYVNDKAVRFYTDRKLRSWFVVWICVFECVSVCMCCVSV